MSGFQFLFSCFLHSTDDGALRRKRKQTTLSDSVEHQVHLTELRDTELQLRARTLSCLAAALQDIDRSLVSDIVEESFPHPVALPINTGDPSFADDGKPISIYSRLTRLKVLNSLARLFVREHEIVAVLAKRSAQKPGFEFVVARDSGSEDKEDDIKQANGFRNTSETSLSRNSRLPTQNSSLLDLREKVLEVLDDTTTASQLLAFLYTFPRVDWETHILSIERLVNVLVGTFAKGTKITQNRRLLLLRYTLFRSAPKVKRRLSSTTFVNFLEAMRKLPKREIMAATGYMNLEISRREKKLFRNILQVDHPSVHTGYCKALLESLTRSEEPKVYKSDSSMAIQELIIFTLEETIRTITLLADLSAKNQQTVSYREFARRIFDAELWSKYLEKLVHSSPIVNEHMSAIEPLLRTGSGVQTEDSEVDQDGGLTDTIIEATTGKDRRHWGLQCLCLAVYIGTAIRLVTNPNILPKEPIHFTTTQLPQTNLVNDSELEDWQDIVGNMYLHSNKGVPSGGQSAISSEEAIKACIAYAEKHPNRFTKLFTTSRAKQRFTGSQHGECILATLRYISTMSTKPQIISSNYDLNLIRNTYRYIGVSKRCCPLCIKLLSLLSNDANGIPIEVLAGHGHIYPAELPPFLPRDIILTYLSWLEGLVRELVDKVVIKKRQGSEKGVKRGPNGDPKPESSPGLMEDIYSTMDYTGWQQYTANECFKKV